MSDHDKSKTDPNPLAQQYELNGKGHRFYLGKEDGHVGVEETTGQRIGGLPTPQRSFFDNFNALGELLPLTRTVGTFPGYIAQEIQSTPGLAILIPPHGFVELVDRMGYDQDIVEAARTSYGNGTRRTTDKDEPLIRHLLSGGYMMRAPHTSPFEMVELKFRIKIPMDTWRQMIRHRTANVNEYSTRYSEAIDECFTVPPGEWRLQSTTNKQGSSGFLPVFAKSPGDKDGRALTFFQSELQERAYGQYQDRLDAGVAREQARMDLPLSTYTIAYWKCDLHNILHFLNLRLDSHAQKEIRDYALAIAAFVQGMFPLTWRAFTDYKLNAMTFSRQEQHALKMLIGMKQDINWLGTAIDTRIEAAGITNKREKAAFVTKLRSLGVLVP